jgi:MoxR-like ATPase
MQLKTQVQNLLTELNKGVLEKEQAISLALLSAMAGESIFLLGAPGVAKSLIARRLKFAFKDAQSFEYLMNRFSTPDEIFGPISISKLKNEDKYERIVENYLPSAQIVFLDEIWKAGPSIQNALLTVLNEKVYRNGTTEIKIPMKALIAASNELPAKHSGLEALWDRFLVRFEVKSVKNEKNFNDLLTKPLKSYEDNVPEDLKITDEQFAEIQTAIDDIEVPENVLNVIHTIRQYIQAHNENDDNKENKLYISDRRWRKIVRLLRTTALLNDRNSVDLMDCLLIYHCVWHELQQQNILYSFLKESVQKHGYKLNVNFIDIKIVINELETEIKEETSFIKNTKKEILQDARVQYYEILNFRHDANLILQTDLNSLSNTNSGISLYYWYTHYGQVHRNSTWNIRKGNSPFTLFIQDVEYSLKTIVNGDKRQITKKPHAATEKHWDERVETILSVTKGLKIQLENYQNNDLKHLRTNLFVNPAFAILVETHVTATRTEIEKLEIEVKAIQRNYKSLKNEEVVIP